MNSIFSARIAATVLLMTAMLAPARAAPAVAESERLVAVLQSTAATYDKARACQRLAVIGNREAVPALSALLADEKLAAYARSGLETIADFSAAAALRQALDKLHGKLLAGVVNSLGVRRDAQAVPALGQLARNRDAGVADEAVAALGQIATADAVRILQQELKADSVASRPAVAEACLACADRLWAQDKQQEATALIDGLRHAAVPQRFRVAATHRAILAPGPLALPLLVEQLKSADDALFAAAVSASRRLPGGEVTQALVAELDRSPPARQILLVAALGDRREPAVVRALEKVAAAGAMEVRLTAIRVLGQLGETSAARKAAGASNSELREAAIRTLGHIAGPDDLPLLWNRLQTANSARETDIAKEALSAACLRISDRDASVARLADYIEHAPASAQCFLLELIGRMGGPRALAVVVAGAHKSGEVQATALQALGAWMSPDAAPPLLELAKTLPDDRLQTRALRGYLRIARQMDLTPDARLAMCQEALRAARRDDERKLALQALVRTASANSLTVAVEHLAQPGLREEAALAAVAIAEKIAPREPQAVAAAMRQVLRSGVSGQPAVRARQLLEKRN